MSRIRVEGVLDLDGKGWEATLNKAERGVAHLAHESLNHLKGAIAGAFAIGAVESLLHSTIAFAAQIGDTATRLGVSTDAAQEFSYAARQSGAELDQVAKGLDKLAQNLEVVKQGGDAGANMAESFKRLGVTVDDIQSKSPEQIFRQIGAALEGMNVTGRVSADILEIFGKGGTKLIPVLKELRDNAEAAHEKGLIMSPNEIKTLKEAEDALDRLGTKTKVLAGYFIAGAGVIANGKLFGAIRDFGDINGSSEKATMEGTIAAEKKTSDDRKALNDMLDENGRRTERTALTLSPDDQKKQEDELVRLNQDSATKEEKARFNRLSTEQQINEVLSAQVDLKERLKKLTESGEGGSFAAAQYRNQLADTTDQLNGLYDKKLGKTAFPDSGAASKGFQGNSLMSVGNFLGTGAQAVSGIGDKTNDLLKNIHKTLGEIKSGLNNGTLGVPK